MDYRCLDFPLLNSRRFSQPQSSRQPVFLRLPRVPANQAPKPIPESFGTTKPLGNPRNAWLELGSGRF